jgi:hypothetical protein
MCPPSCALENRDPEEPPDFYCQVAHLRVMVLGLSVPSHGECIYCEGGKEYGSLVSSAKDVLKKTQYYQLEP